MFNVLVIAYYFPPKGLSGVQRTLKFVKYLPQYNWRPFVLTSGVNAYYAYDYSLLKDLEGKNIDIIRVDGTDVNSMLPMQGLVAMPSERIRKFLSYLSSFIFVPDNKKGWSKKAYISAKEIITNNKIDLIFVSAPPFSSFNLGVRLKNEFNIPLVLDYRDLWYGFQFGRHLLPFHKAAIKRMEYKALKTADKVIVINRRIKEKIMEYFPFVSHRQITIIPHGFDPEDFHQSAKLPRTSQKMILTYSGLFYENITPKYLFSAFKTLTIERPDISSNIEIQLIGVVRKEVIALINELGLQNHIKCLGYLPHIESINRLLASDVLWITVGKGKNADTISSSKFFEYIGTGKPVFGSVVDGVLKTALQDYGASYISSPDNPEEIKRMLVKIYEDFRLGKLPEPNSEFVEKYRRDFLTEQLSKEFQFLVRE